MAEFVEFENENRLRKYPFAEGSSFVSAEGLKIDNSFVLDAMLYIYRPTGPIRLSSIDYINKVITLSDDKNDIATAIFDGTKNKIDFTCVVYKVGDVEITKPAGSIYVSNEFFSGYGVQHFNSLYFSASCICPVNPSGVEGIVIDGQLLTGVIHFISSTGSVDSIFSSGPDGGTYLNFRIRPTLQESDKIRSIKNIVVRVEEGSPFIVSSYGTGVQISLGEISREDICANSPQGRAQDYYEGIYDTCKRVTTPGVPVYHPFNQVLQHISINMKNNNGRFSIFTPDQVTQNGIIVNPLSVSPNAGMIAPVPLNITPDMSQIEREKALANSLNSGASGNSVSIMVPGLI